MNTKLLLDNLRNVPDFPKPGIHFKDVSTLFKNHECIEEMLNELLRLYKDKGTVSYTHLTLPTKA